MAKERSVRYTAEFLKNSFSIDIMHDHGELTKGIHKLEGFKWSGNNRHLLSSKAKYSTDVFMIQSDLVSTCQEINMVKVFLSRFPLKAYYQSHDIDEIDYFEYHLETLLHKIHTVSEIMKLLINQVYDLKIQPKDCSWDALRKKVGTKIAPMKIIDKHFKAFKSLIDRRHLSSHRGKYEDELAEELNHDFGRSIYKIYASIGEEISEEMQKYYPRFYLEYGIKQYRKERLKEVRQLLAINDAFMKDFLTSLHPQYVLHFEKLSNK